MIRKTVLSLKNFIKSNSFLFNLIESYLVRFDYGYLHSDWEVNRFLKKLRKNTADLAYSHEKRDRFIIIGDKNVDSTLRKAVFGDIDYNNVNEVDCQFFTTRQLENTSLEKIHKLYFKINKIIPLPFKAWWEKQYTTNSIQIKEDENLFLIFMAGAYFEETFSQPGLFQKLVSFSEVSFCKRILYMVDPIDKYPSLPRWFPYFDMVASYSHDDEKKYNAVYIDSPCVDYKCRTEQIKYDIYFRAMDSGRGKMVDSCFHLLSQNDVKCNFFIQTTDGSYESKEGMIFSNDRVSYDEMLREEMEANVMLEVIIPGIGSGTTLRYKEAIMYGKKLLTNNPNVSGLELFNPKYIHYFEKPSDIDIEWVKNRDEVNYGYQNEFSVDAFCKKIKALYTNTNERA